MYRPLPIDAALDEIRGALDENKNLIVVAEPGSGKTTRIPPGCLDAHWLGKNRLLMLEPRRVAARAAANFIARERGEKTGETIGYRVRNDTRISHATRLEVVTEGILTRMIQSDPSLEGIGMIIFDEFHERSLHVDLALALALEVQRELRPDLRLVVMSATIDANKLAILIGNSKTIESPGRQFPVEVRYLAQAPTRPLDQVVSDAILRALREENGDLLVFLPGRGEINRVNERLRDKLGNNDPEVLSLHSEIPAELQDRVLNPDPGGKRRIILSTNIAETSVTIPGLRIVIDSGLVRTPRFDPGRGISGLETVMVSRASATQRAGRAGRQEPGVCYRLWTEREQAALQPFGKPELLHADLTTFLLELAAWGSVEVDRYRFLDKPASAQLNQAAQLLKLLGAIDDDSRITPHGRAMLNLGVQPRLANMLIKARELGIGAEACDVCALLEESVGGDRELDQILSNRFETLKDFRAGRKVMRHGSWQRIDQESQRLRRMIGNANQPNTESTAFGKLIALAFPERVAVQRERNGTRYLMRSGTGAVVPENSPLKKHGCIAIAQLDGAGANAKVFLAEGIEQRELEDIFTRELQEEREIIWDNPSQSVRGRIIKSLGAIVFDERPFPVSDEEALPLLLDAFRTLGFATLPFRSEGASLLERSQWLRKRGVAPEHLPDLNHEFLINNLEEWLGGFLAGVRRLTDLQRIDIDHALTVYFPYQTKQLIERLAPLSVTLPTGRDVPVDYSGERAPSISARLQELFGQRRTPTVADGAIPLTIELLSPAGRPLQVTADLESFWNNSYEQVRKEMQGRYPKHSWPTNPLEAAPMRGTRKRTQ